MPTSRQVHALTVLEDILDKYWVAAEIATELTNWRDKMPSSLSKSAKRDQLNRAITALEEGAIGLEQFSDNISPILEAIPGTLDSDIRYTIHLMYKGYRTPRWVKLANLIAAYKASVETIKGLANTSDLDDATKDSIESYLNDVGGVISDMEKVEIPKMFG